MKKVIWSVNQEKVSINFSGNIADFQKMLFEMMRESPDMCGSLTGVVYEFWQEGAGINCGELGSVIERRENQ